MEEIFLQKQHCCFQAISKSSNVWKSGLISYSHILYIIEWLGSAKMNLCAALRQIFWSKTILCVSVRQRMFDIYCLISSDIEWLIVIESLSAQKCVPRTRQVLSLLRRSSGKRHSDSPLGQCCLFDKHITQLDLLEREGHKNLDTISRTLSDVAWLWDY